jgi:hypothetical protein
MNVIELQMRALGKRLVGIDDVATLVHRLRTDPKYRFQTREEIIQVTERAVERGREANAAVSHSHADGGLYRGGV